MIKHSVRFDAHVPPGWSKVDPAGAGEPNASTVFLRDADNGSSRVPVITITEHLFRSLDVDLKGLALEYTERMRKKVIGLEIERSEYITRDAPAEYGQEMEFLLVSGVAAKLAHMTIAIPAVGGETCVLEIAFCAPKEEYSACSGEFGEFLKSLRVVTDGAI